MIPITILPPPVLAGRDSRDGLVSTRPVGGAGCLLCGCSFVGIFESKLLFYPAQVHFLYPGLDSGTVEPIHLFKETEFSGSFQADVRLHFRREAPGLETYRWAVAYRLSFPH